MYCMHIFRLQYRKIQTLVVHTTQRQKNCNRWSLRIAQNLKPSVYERWSFTRGSYFKPVGEFALSAHDNPWQYKDESCRETALNWEIGSCIPGFRHFLSWLPPFSPLRLRNIRHCCIISHYSPASQPFRTVNSCPFLSRFHTPLLPGSHSYFSYSPQPAGEFWL